ncbi:MAG: VOC family protein [Deltaproteobacteria bacterium]|nr:VOC family protein [Deltaproteobacteria bacterium]
MEPRISIITLGVKDLDKSYRFYKDGLGFPTTWSPEKGVVFFKTRGTCLALYPFEKLAEDVNPALHPGKPAFSGVALAYNTRTKDEVEEVLKKAKRAGGKIEKPAQDAFWGGYSGYFSDPDGYLWEVAFGAFDFNEDGSLAIT